MKKLPDDTLTEGGNDVPPNVPLHTEDKKQTVTIRHKTPHPHYRRAGLILTDQFKPYEVTEKQLEILKKDKWVEIKQG